MRPSVVLAILLLAGCGGAPRDEAAREEPAHEEHAGEEHAEAPAEHAEGGEESALLTLDPEMLRDLKLTTFAAELRPAGEGVTALGEVRVDDRSYAEVGSVLPARVVRLLAEPGQAVRSGQPLAELQSTELGRARAERVAAQARAELARQTLERKRGLAEERIVSRGELQRAEAESAEAAAELMAAEAALAALGQPGGPVRTESGDLSRFLLRSPIAGTVLERTAVRGQTTDPARPLFRVADLSHLWLVVQTPESDAVRIARGALAEIRFAALPGEVFRGAVSWTGSEVDPHSRTVPVRIDLPNPGRKLRPGMFATARLAVGSEREGNERVVAIPATALQRLDDQWIVFLPRGQGSFEVRPIQRGRDLGGEVAVLSGLRPGETVVDEGSFLLRAEAEKKEGGGEHHH